MKRLEVQIERDDSYHKKKYELLKTKYEHPAHLIGKGADDFVDIVVNLDRFYVLKRLIFAIEIHSRKYGLNEQLDSSWDKSLQSILKNQMRKWFILSWM